jgi:hypothetical protein
VQLRLLASGILYRACLRSLPRAPTAEEKMALHARVEEAAWALPDAMLRAIEGRDVDDGVPDTDAWRELVGRLAQAP